MKKINKFDKWLQEPVCIRKDEVLASLAGITAGIGIFSVFVGSCYASFKVGTMRGHQQIRDKLLSANTLDILANGSRDNEPAVVTLCGLSSKSEDEYVNNVRLWYENRDCSEEYMKEHEEMDRERYRQRYADFIGK